MIHFFFHLVLFTGEWNRGFWSPFLLFIGKGLAYLLKFPSWLTFALEWISSWIVLHLSIKYVLYIKLVNISIWEHGTLILSFFVSFLFIGIDLIYSSIEQRKQPLDEQAKAPRDDSRSFCLPNL